MLPWFATFNNHGNGNQFKKLVANVGFTTFLLLKFAARVYFRLRLEGVAG